MYGAILGLLGAILPRLISLIQERLDHKREMEMMRFQQAYASSPKVNSVEDLVTVDLSDLESARKDTVDMIDRSEGWVKKALTFWNGQVRPTLALGAFSVYCYLLVVTSGQLTFGSPLHDDIFFFIVTFYFGGRALHKERRG